jgi:RNA polymerase subunit RPABC4/transcription elongation factor Spt4
MPGIVQARVQIRGKAPQGERQALIMRYLSLTDDRTFICPKCGEISTITEVIMTADLPDGEPCGAYIMLRSADSCPKCEGARLEMLLLVGHSKQEYKSKPEMIAHMNELVKGGYIVKDIVGFD